MGKASYFFGVASLTTLAEGQASTIMVPSSSLFLVPFSTYR